MIAETFCVSERKLAKINGVRQPVYCGQILKIPEEQGNRYTVQAGDTKELLCGTKENFEEWNGTDVFYIGMQVIIGGNKKRE